MTSVTIQVDLPPDVEIGAYQRYGDGHGFEISWPLPTYCTCDQCHHEEPAHIEFKDTVQVVRDLDLWGQPSFWIYRPAFHRCSYCNHRQYIIPPFKRKDTSYTFRFEQHVLRLLIGSNEEEVARRLGISAETVHFIVRHQLADAKDKEIDPQRKVTDVGIDEMSLKKGHQLYSTILTDLTNPEHPEVLAVAEGRDEAAAQKCLEKLSEAQRQQVKTFRADMSQAYHNACKHLLPKAKAVVDRFHVAKTFNKAIDKQRKEITQAYKAKLSAAERKEFRSGMWAFRKPPQELTNKEKRQLADLFRRLPLLRTLYRIRLRFQSIFDTALDQAEGLRRLKRLFRMMTATFPELATFVRTFEDWQQQILNYFDAGQTSGVVEGINNKARGILNRCFGLKSGDSLWTRLILDLNRGKEVVLYTIKQVHNFVEGFRVQGSLACT